MISSQNNVQKYCTKGHEQVLHSRKMNTSETENTYKSTFFVHFVENIENIILYVNVHTIFNSKRW